jgi:hypothetical protein
MEEYLKNFFLYSIENHGTSLSLIKKKFDEIFFIKNIKNQKIKLILYFTIKNLIGFLKSLLSVKNSIIRLQNKILFKKKQELNTKIKFNDLDTYNEQYVSKGYCFVENFIDEKSYNDLIKNWPKPEYFPVRKAPLKYYSFSFKYDISDYQLISTMTNEKKLNQVKFLAEHPVIKNFFNFILSNDCLNNFLKLLPKNQNKEKWYCNTIYLTEANEGGFLLPHRDVVSKNIENEESFNIALFLDGNNFNPYKSGALGLYEDNEFQRPIFIPKNLKNSMFAYDTKKNFLHGFPTMEKNCFRKTVNIGFRKF